MVKIAVTGHMDLAERSVPLIKEALLSLFSDYPAAELTGVSCLAAGADAVFADAVLAAGGRLVGVLPSADYRQRMVGESYAAEFDRLCRAASEVKVMPYRRATTTAYAAANRFLLGRADLLLTLLA
jgi:hypothetical protein